MKVSLQHTSRIVRARRGPRSGPEPQRLQAGRCRGGALQDRALYSCPCGLAFDAPVSTSVRCPECGTTQAW